MLMGDMPFGEVYQEVKKIRKAIHKNLGKKAGVEMEYNKGT